MAAKVILANTRLRNSGERNNPMRKGTLMSIEPALIETLDECLRKWIL